MNCGGRIYKGQSIEISVPFTASGFTDFLAEYFTDGEKKIQRTIEDVVIEDGILTAYFQDTDLDLLNDGVIRYKITYKIDGFDCVQCTNTPFYLKTPADYNAVTPEDIYDEGYDAGYGPLYTRDYAENVSYEDVREYFEDLAEVNIGACSALYRNGKVLRSYDWFYNYQVPFLVSTPNGVMGVACGLSGATAQTMEEGLPEEVEKLIPWYLVDGMNKHGLCVEVNVVPSLGNSGTHPADPSDRICSLALVRYILDNYSSVEDACSGLADLEVFFPQALLDMGYETHWMLADREKSIVLEIIDGQFVAVTSDKSTNFHLEGVEFNADGSIYTNVDAAEGNLPSSMGIEAYGAGLERWNILNSAEDMDDFEVLDALKYSQSYTKDMDTDFWYSEFVGTDITVDTPYTDEAFAERIEKYKAKWDERKRDENTVWISTHQVVYDLNNLSMEVRTQEKNGVYRKMILEDGGGVDFSVIGYDDTDSASADRAIESSIAYSKTKYDAWDPTRTWVTLFQYDKQLVFAPKIDTSNVTNMLEMFNSCSSLTTIPQLDTSKVRSMKSMFLVCTSLTTIPELDTRNVTNMQSMFNGCTSLTSIPQLVTSNVTTMNQMFYSCYSLTTVPQLDTSNVTDMSYMFRDCTSLTSIPELDTSNVTNMTQMFYNCSSLETVPFMNTSKVEQMGNMFLYCGALKSIPQLDTSKVGDMIAMFMGCSSLETIPMLNTENADAMWWMFEGCTSLKSIPLLNTSKVTKMNNMFRGCSSLETIPQLDTSKVRNMDNMFEDCYSLTSLPELDCSSCTEIDYFFGYSDITTLTDLGGFLNLKCNWNDGRGLNKCPNLTVQSLLNVLNGLYDFTGHGETPTSSQGNLQLGQTNYDKLTAEQIAIGTNKGWTITA